VKARVVVGIGNPGAKYAFNRHNLGFMVVDRLAEMLGVTFKEEPRFHALSAKGTVAGEALYLLKPTTYVNESGVALRRMIDYYKIPTEGVIIVVDDIALPLGAMRLKEKGGAGGHNGLKSVATHLGTQQYIRLRMGIGAAGQKALTSHVLGDFSKEEQEVLPELLTQGAKVIQRLCKEETHSVMNDVNRRATKSESRDAGQETKNDENKDEKTAVRRDVHP
jgi:PTH1 family peptidyl-tRNA hydrolase